MRLETDQLEQVVRDTLAQLLKGKRTVTISPDSMLKLPKAKPDERLKILFAEDAWRKMEALVKGCPKEIAWHGLVKPMDEGFYIYDILVYPQIATSTTVESDDDRYHTWLESLKDEQFNAIRFQGHSHVNMGVSPSGVDTDFYETLAQHVRDYYIFFIMNKSGSLWCNVYDIKNNLVFDNEDIDIESEYDGVDYDAWYEQVLKENMKTKVFAPSKGVVTPAYPYASGVQDPMDDYDPWRGYARGGY